MSLEIETDRGDSDREARTAPAMSPEMAAVLDSAEAFVEQARLRLALDDVDAADQGAASCIAAPRTRHSFTASASPSAPLATKALYSPSE